MIFLIDFTNDYDDDDDDQFAAACDKVLQDNIY